MPKVTPEYRTARRAQLLDAARRCFLRDGFQGTSMQSLLAEADVSAGAFYGYFRSKEDVILAIVEESLADVTALIRALADDPRPSDLAGSVATVLEAVRTRHEQQQVGALAVLVWAEALRNPQLAGRYAETVARIRTELAGEVRRQQAARPDAAPADAADADAADADAVARLLVLLIPGLMVHLALFGPVAIDEIPATARAVWC